MLYFLHMPLTGWNQLPTMNQDVQGYVTCPGNSMDVLNTTSCDIFIEDFDHQEIEIRVCDELFTRECMVLSRIVGTDQIMFISNLRIQKSYADTTLITTENSKFIYHPDVDPPEE